ncbi:MAG: EamA family transporter [Actinomycetota bacterium]
MGFMQSPAAVTEQSTPAPARYDLELDLVDRPTPFLMVDLEQVVSSLQSLRKGLPGFRIFYAMKANPMPEILEVLAQHGTGFEIASARELETLLALDIRADNVLFSSPVKAPLDVRMAYDCGVPGYAIDSDTEIIKLALEAPGSAVYVRLSTTGAGSRFPLSKRFGVGPNEAVELLKLAADFGLTPYGCTFHVGSQNTNPRSWERPIEDCAYVMRAFEPLTGTRLQMLDIGGGFPAQYAEKPIPSLEEFGSTIRRALRGLPYPVELFAEPGRALVATAGVLASTVIGRRRRREQTWVHLDVGPYNGFMEANAFLGGERNPISWTATQAGSPTTECTLTGPTCDDGDVLQDDVALPRDLGVGDRVYIGAAGAYSTSIATNFNGFTPPKSCVKSPSELFMEENTTLRRRGETRRHLVQLSRESLGLLAVLAAATLWAISANVAEGLYVSGVTGLQVAGAETVIAGICLLAWRYRRGARPPRSSLSIKQRLLLGSSLSLMVCTYYAAIELLDVGSAVVLHYTAPVVVVAWTLVRTKRAPGTRVLVSLGLACAGILLVTQLIETGLGALNPLGVLVALASAVFLATYTLVGDSATRTAAPLEVTTQAFIAALPLSIGALFASGMPGVLLSSANLGRVLFIGVFGALLATSLYLWGIDKVHSVKAAIAANLEPVVASMLAWLWFGHGLSPVQFAGAGMIFGAVILLHERESQMALSPLRIPKTALAASGRLG